MSCLECKKVTSDHYYKASVNEDGWRCGRCGEPLGYRHDLDTALIDLKVGGLLMDLCDQQLIYVSNGTEGMVIEENVVQRCRELGRYDQYTILREILADLNVGVDSHADYWAKKAT